MSTEADRVDEADKVGEAEPTVSLPEADSQDGASASSEIAVKRSTLGAAAPVAEGAVLGQRYRLDRLLGEGGMGSVWAATHLITNHKVALKLLKSGASLTVEKRLIREARTSSAIRHPNVVAVHDLLDTEIGPVLVMDLLSGESLAERLGREKCLSVKETIDLLLPVAEALSVAHAQGIIHRDLKPANIFLTRDTNDKVVVKVLDFGIAKLLPEPGAEAVSQMTRTGSLLGTPCYMSPEQAFGENDIDARSDIWSLGIVLYQCLSGVLPTAAENVGQVLKILLTRPIAPLSTVAPSVPAPLSDLVRRMLQQTREQRPSDMNEVVHKLAENRAETPKTRRPVTRWTGVLVVALVVTALTATFWKGMSHSSEPLAPESLGGPTPVQPPTSAELAVSPTLPASAPAQRTASETVTAPARADLSTDPPKTSFPVRASARPEPSDPGPNSGATSTASSPVAPTSPRNLSSAVVTQPPF